MSVSFRSKTSGLAITSLVMGILSLICFSLFAAIPAIIFGHIACSSIKRSRGIIQGKGLAIAGLVIGYAYLAFVIVTLPLTLPAIRRAMDRGQMMQQLDHARQIQISIQSMALDGKTTGDKSLGYPADVGITSVSQLKALLIKDGGLSAWDVKRLRFEDFLIGNVSAADPRNTILIRSVPKSSSDGSFIVFNLGGDGAALRKSQAAYADPPRNPAYLKP